MKSFVKHLLKISIVGTVCYFIFVQIIRNWDVIRRHIDQFSWSDFLVSMLLFLFGQFCFNVGWFKIISSNGPKTRFCLSSYYWTLSSLGKYVPGRIWQFAGRLYLFDKLGFSKTQIVSCSIVEQFHFLLSSLSLFCLFALMNYDMIPKTYFTMGIFGGVVLVLGGFILIHPRVLNACISIVSKFIKKIDFSYDMTYKDSLMFFIYFFVGWLSIGLGFAFLTKSLMTIDMKLFLCLAGANSGAYFSGYIVLLTPAGLGVREGVLTYLLNMIFMKGVGAVLSVLTRIWYIVGEMLYLALSFVVTFAITKKYGNWGS